MRILQKKVTAAFVIVVLGLGSLTACQGNAPQAKETPKPTQTAMSPTRTTVEPTPSPTPEPYTFSFTDQEGYNYVYSIDTSTLPQFTATIDTTLGPPGYSVVTVHRSQVIAIDITGSYPGKATAPKRPPRGIDIYPIWNEMKNPYCIEDNREKTALEAIHDKFALCAWDWGEYNLADKGNGEWTDPFVGADGEGGRGALNWSQATDIYVTYNGESITGQTGDRRSLHGNVYIVKEDQAEAFAQTMLHPSGFQVVLYGYKLNWDGFWFPTMQEDFHETFDLIDCDEWGEGYCHELKNVLPYTPSVSKDADLIQYIRL